MRIFVYESDQSCMEISAEELHEIYQAAIHLYQELDMVDKAQVLSQWPRPEPEDTIKLLRELLGLQKEE